MVRFLWRGENWSGSSGEVKIGQVPLEVNTSQVLMRGEHQQGSLKVVSESDEISISMTTFVGNMMSMLSYIVLLVAESMNPR